MQVYKKSLKWMILKEKNFGSKEITARLAHLSLFIYLSI